MENSFSEVLCSRPGPAWGLQRKGTLSHLKLAWESPHEFKKFFLNPTTILPSYMATPICLTDSKDLGTKLICVHSLIMVSQYPCEMIEAEVLISWLKLKFVKAEILLYVTFLFTLWFLPSFICSFSIHCANIELLQRTRYSVLDILQWTWGKGS